jgi:thiol-disulfide isomerase/thioredoxin
MMKEAYAAAKKENKKVFVIFHASWCIWCRKMDTSMNDAICKKFFDDNFIVRHMVVDESKDKKNLETPGGQEFKIKYRGAEMGLPFWLIFDSNGSLLADAKIRTAGAGIDAEGKNTGCPANEEEVNYFIEVLKKTTSLKSNELEIIKQRFRKNEM